MNDLAIFDDSYFESDLNFELDAATETVGDALSNFFTAFSAKIKQIGTKNDMRVQDLVKCGYSEKEAISIIKKSAIFFNQNGYAKKYIEVSTIGPHSVISYKDLNAEGKKFSKTVVDTFKDSYNKHSDEIISKFAQRARVKLASMESKEKIIVFVINLVISAIRALFKIGVVEAIPIIGSALSSGCAVAIIICALIDLGLISLIANYIIKGKYEKKAQKVMYTTNYRDTNESANIFDENYFADADIALEAKTDTVISISDFNYMPKKDAEKAYKHVVRTMITDGMLDEDPNSDKIQKGNALWYHLTLKSNIVRLVNRVHKCKFDAADEFISEFDRLWNNEQNTRKENAERLQQYKHERNMVKYARTGRYYF